MKTPRRKLLPLDKSRSVSVTDLAGLKSERIAADQVKDAGRTDLRFPLDLVALLAKGFIDAGMSEETEQLSYTKAARRAIMLLDACAEELRHDAVASLHRELAASQQGLATEWKQFWDDLTVDGYVPFRKALLYITEKRTFGEALPVFRRFREYLRDHPGYYENSLCETSSSANLTISQELTLYKDRGVIEAPETGPV